MKPWASRRSSFDLIGNRGANTLVAARLNLDFTAHARTDRAWRVIGSFDTADDGC